MEESDSNEQIKNKDIIKMNNIRNSNIKKPQELFDFIDGLISDAGKILEDKCLNKVKDLNSFDDEYKDLMLKESEKIGEEFKKRVIEKSSFFVPEIVNEQNSIEEIRKLANEEFDKMIREFEEKLNLKSKTEFDMLSEDSICISLKGDNSLGRRTLAIIKPDAYKYADEIIHIVKKFGFVIVQERRVTLSPEEASLFYGEHLSKAFSLRLIQHLSSGPIVALCIASAHCPNTVSAWREIMGPSDVAEAAAIFPNTLRAKYGDTRDQVKNALHGSHSIADAEKEIHFFFPDIILDPLPKVTNIGSILNKDDQETLKKGLVMLCREKPENPLSWFAHWLLHNNPNNPSCSLDMKPTIHFDDALGTGKKCFKKL